jgi:hypothetical protein
MIQTEFESSDLFFRHEKIAIRKKQVFDEEEPQCSRGFKGLYSPKTQFMPSPKIRGMLMVLIIGGGGKIFRYLVAVHFLDTRPFAALANRFVL